MEDKPRLSLVSKDHSAPAKPGARPAGGPSRKASKQEAILREAAIMFNQHGVGAVGFGDLAKRMGVGRATFYHYVSDREDLIFRCYQNSCEAETERLDIASEADPGLQQVLEFMRLSLAPEADQTAIIADTGVLGKGPKSIIDKARRRNFDRLADMIGDGINAGNIRPCDERIIARILPSMVAFTRMADRWVKRKSGSRNLDALVDFIAYGSAAHRKSDFHLHKNAEDFSKISLSGFGDQKISDLKMEQILMKGSQLINLHGVVNVSLEDVANALGATRGTVYHYFNDREDLVQKCLERSFELYDAFVDFADAHGRTGLEKASIVSHLNSQAMVGSLQPVAGWMGLDVLSPALQKRAQKRLREILHRTEKLAEEGMEDGSRRIHDYKAVTLARAGAYLWIPKWISDIEHPSPYRIADEVVALFNLGLAAVTER
ncbi:TetR family transcriptional regulator [Hyphomonas sp.]|uniref:TetR family transcriptional regulator n=1 Tax=Hyphomonas sp. TaxID=87 RepID=UPI003F716CE6